MKIISIDGRLGKDAEIISKDGRSYLRFSLANNVFENGQTKTEWLDVYSYDVNIINGLAKRLTKGQYVFVSGDYRVQQTTDNTGRVWLNQRVIANTIQFLYSGVKKEGTEGTQTTAQQAATPTAEPSTYTPAQTTAQPEVSVYSQAPIPTPTHQVVETVTPQPAYATVASSISTPAADDDLPF